jgi:hypothetical protein
MKAGGKQGVCLRYVPPKRRLTFTGLHGVISQKIVLSTHKLFIHTVCDHILSGKRSDIFTPAGGGMSMLCYRVCLASLGGMRGRREVDGKVKDGAVGQCHHQLLAFFFLDPISP